MSDSPTLTLYIKPGCPWCEEVIEYLDAKGHTYDLRNVRASREDFEEMQALSGQTKAPTMTWGNALLADFGVDELVPFLDEHGIRPA